MPTTEMRDALEHVPAAVTTALQEMSLFPSTTPGELTDMACDMNEYACYLDIRGSAFSDLYVATWREVLFRLELDSATSDAADVTLAQVQSALNRS